MVPAYSTTTTFTKSLVSTVECRAGPLKLQGLADRLRREDE